VDRTFAMQLGLIDAQNRQVWNHMQPLGYALWPVREWPEGLMVRQTFRLPVPRIPPGRYRLVMQMVWRNDAAQAGVSASDDPHLIAAAGVLPFGWIEVKAR
jgi:hypothetical protein